MLNTVRLSISYFSRLLLRILMKLALMTKFTSKVSQMQSLTQMNRSQTILTNAHNLVQTQTMMKYSSMIVEYRYVTSPKDRLPELNNPGMSCGNRSYQTILIWTLRGVPCRNRCHVNFFKIHWTYHLETKWLQSCSSAVASEQLTYLNSNALANNSFHYKM